MTDKSTDDSKSGQPLGLGLGEGLGPLPEAAGFRMRYRSEPGMVGHYPWTYADHKRFRANRPDCEYENLFTEEQVRTLLTAKRAASTSAGLTPCPFCGERPRLTLRPDDAEASTYFAAVACYCGGYSACAHKMATAPTADEAEAKARAAWNRRA